MGTKIRICYYTCVYNRINEEQPWKPKIKILRFSYVSSEKHMYFIQI